VECYTKHPESGEGGWDIRFIFVQARCPRDAVALARRHVPHFDEVITCGCVGEPEPLSGCESLVLPCGEAVPRQLPARVA